MLRRQLYSDMRCDGVSSAITSSLIGNTKEVNDKHCTFDIYGIGEKRKSLKNKKIPEKPLFPGFSGVCQSKRQDLNLRPLPRTQRSTKLSHASSTAKAIITTGQWFVNHFFLFL